MGVHPLIEAINGLVCLVLRAEVLLLLLCEGEAPNEGVDNVVRLGMEGIHNQSSLAVIGLLLNQRMIRYHNPRLT